MPLRAPQTSYRLGMVSNPDPRGKRPATNRLSYEMAVKDNTSALPRLRTDFVPRSKHTPSSVTKTSH